VLAGVLVADGGLFFSPDVLVVNVSSSTRDRISGPFLIVDAYVDSHELSCALVWLSACGRLAHPIYRPTFMVRCGIHFTIGTIDVEEIYINKK